MRPSHSGTNNPFAFAGAPAGTVAAFYVPATTLPTLSTNTTVLRLIGKYTVDVANSVRIVYSYMRMKSVDFSYDAMRDGGISGQFPTYETAPDCKVQAVAVSYIHRF